MLPECVLTDMDPVTRLQAGGLRNHPENYLLDTFLAIKSKKILIIESYYPPTGTYYAFVCIPASRLSTIASASLMIRSTSS